MYLECASAIYRCKLQFKYGQTLFPYLIRRITEREDLAGTAAFGDFGCHGWHPRALRDEFMAVAESSSARQVQSKSTKTIAKKNPG